MKSYFRRYARLPAHSQGEEEQLQRQLRHFPELHVLIEQGLQEHRSIKEYIEESGFVDKASEHWKSTFGQMMETMEKYVELEEEKCFPRKMGYWKKSRQNGC